MRTFRTLLLAAATTASFVSLATAQTTPTAPSATPAAPAPLPPPASAPADAPAPASDAAAPIAAPVAADAPAPIDAAPAATAGADAAIAEKAEKKLDIEIKPGGYLHADAKAFLEDETTDDFQIKRLRPKLDGVAFGHFPFKLLLDFAGSRLQVLDAWVEVDYSKAAVLRVGKDKTQFGLERLASATALSFIERGLPNQLVPNRDIGIQLRGDLFGGTLHYVAAVFDGTPDVTSVDQESDDNLELNGHLFIQPFKKAGPAALKNFGIGAATTYGRAEGAADFAGGNANTQLASYKSAGGATIFKWAASKTDNNATAFADGIRFRATAHGYWYWQRFGVLGEYVRAQHGVVLGGDHARLAHQAWQGAATVLLTDDEASYKGVKPKKPFSPGKGLGAFELAARYSELAIDPETFEMGYASRNSSVENARAFAGGINWYLNNALKVQLNYEHTRFQGGDADGADRKAENAVLTRLQLSL